MPKIGIRRLTETEKSALKGDFLLKLCAGVNGILPLVGTAAVVGGTGGLITGLFTGRKELVRKSGKWILKGLETFTLWGGLQFKQGHLNQEMIDWLHSQE